MPIVIYLDDIAMYRDTHKQVLEDILEATKQLITASFMLNLHEPAGPGCSISPRASLDLG